MRSIALSLWYAPVVAWLLLVSAWAKRATFLWAVLPPIALLLFEKLALRHAILQRLLGYRLQDGREAAFDRTRLEHRSAA